MLIIRKYEDKDWAAIQEIHDLARMYELTGAGLPEAFLRLEDTYENEDLFENEVLVAERDGTVLGFVAYSEEELAWLYVHPSAMRQGIARALVSHVLSLTEGKMTLEVLCGNDPAIKLYEAMGFVTVEIGSGQMPGNEKFSVRAHVMEYNADKE